VENSATYLYAKFNNDRLRNEKALGLTTGTTRRTTVVAIGDPFPCPKILEWAVQSTLSVAGVYTRSDEARPSVNGA